LQSFFLILKIFQGVLYFFWPKYIKAKKDKVLTKAIKYHPLEELLLTSVIYSDSYRRNLLFE